jgi:hypothetical protein
MTDAPRAVGDAHGAVGDAQRARDVVTNSQTVTATARNGALIPHGAGSGIKSDTGDARADRACRRAPANAPSPAAPQVPWWRRPFGGSGEAR